MAVQEALVALMHLFVNTRVFASLHIVGFANLDTLSVVRIPTIFVLLWMHFFLQWFLMQQQSCKSML